MSGSNFQNEDRDPRLRADAVEELLTSVFSGALGVEIREHEALDRLVHSFGEPVQDRLREIPQEMIDLITVRWRHNLAGFLASTAGKDYSLSPVAFVTGEAGIGTQQTLHLVSSAKDAELRFAVPYLGVDNEVYVDELSEPAYLVQSVGLNPIETTGLEFRSILSPTANHEMRTKLLEGQGIGFWKILTEALDEAAGVLNRPVSELMRRFRPEEVDIGRAIITLPDGVVHIPKTDDEVHYLLNIPNVGTAIANAAYDAESGNIFFAACAFSPAL